MAIQKQLKDRIKELKVRYESLRIGRDELLKLLEEAEVAESVYNSNAIENSTLTLRETERILLELSVAREVSTREIFEAKNLARVGEYMGEKAKAANLNKEMILLLHKMLMTAIRDDIAGRFRVAGEYVRVGSYVAPPPEQVEKMMEEVITGFYNDHESYFIGKIARFHLEFEEIHPFNDGNGRIGRAIINWQLIRLGFPPIIVRNKEKSDYYDSFTIHRDKNNLKPMAKIITLGLMESLHKRITYFEGAPIIKLSEFAKKQNKTASSLTNAARRQTIPAFREKGVWKISQNTTLNQLPRSKLRGMN
ncbi:MAG: Fic family protein [Candidatus Liptonbacteria bacterium]|nr:Fic family protein [Candidatus Liptonbacteria bacterium]